MRSLLQNIIKEEQKVCNSIWDKTLSLHTYLKMKKKFVYVTQEEIIQFKMNKKFSCTT